MQRLLILLALVLMLCAGTIQAQEGGSRNFDGAGSYTVRFTLGGRERQTYITVPESYDPDGDPVPLVIILHGAGGDGNSIAQLTGFNDLAEEHGFIVAYPDGINRVWNDARPDARSLMVNDVGFINGLINFVSAQLNIDQNRIYAGGYSMGGMLSFRLGCQLSDRIAAVASVASTFPGYQLDSCLFADPVPVLIVQGTEDPIVPADGYRDPYGNRLMLSASESVRYWAENNFCNPVGALIPIADTNTEDQTVVRLTEHRNCDNNADVMMYLVRGGGHTWPGHPFSEQLSDDLGLGPTNMDIDASQVLWDFFEAHPKADAS